MKELILKLLSEGYNIWVEIVPDSHTLVLQGQHDLMKCLIRKVYMSNDIPTLPLRGSRTDEQPLLPHECTHVLAWCEELKEVWLIPYNMFDPGQRFARLTAKFTPYLITNLRIQSKADAARFRKSMLDRTVKKIVQREQAERHQQSVVEILNALGEETSAKEAKETSQETPGPSDQTGSGLSDAQQTDDLKAH